MSSELKLLNKMTQEELVDEVMEYERRKMMEMDRERVLLYVIRIRSNNLTEFLLTEAGLKNKEEGTDGGMFGWNVGL